MTPDFKVIAAGINITSQIEDRLLSLVVKDEAGFKSDTVEITLDDRDNAIELPLRGRRSSACATSTPPRSRLRKPPRQSSMSSSAGMIP